MGSILKSSPTSTKTGFAPRSAIALAVATKELGTVITSSPSPIPNERIDSINASVPELTPMEYLVPHNSANLFSNFSTSSPRIKLPLLIILEIFCITSS